LKTPASPNAIFPSRIDALCKAHGLSRTALGTAVGLSAETVRNWLKKAEAGALKLTQQLSDFAKAYDTTAAWLLGETAEGAPPKVAGKVSVSIADDFLAAAQVNVITKTMADAVAERLAKRPGWNLSRGLAAVHRIKGLTNPSDEALYNAAIVADIDAELAGEGFPRATAKDLADAPGAAKQKKRR
jgi:transcriptional regulator with XRE-family HTH domain